MFSRFADCHASVRECIMPHFSLCIFHCEIPRALRRVHRRRLYFASCYAMRGGAPCAVCTRDRCLSPARSREPMTPDAQHRTQHATYISRIRYTDMICLFDATPLFPAHIYVYTFLSTCSDAAVYIIAITDFFAAICLLMSLMARAPLRSIYVVPNMQLCHTSRLRSA